MAKGFVYPSQVTLTGHITNIFAYRTETGNLYEYRFEHTQDNSLLVEISLYTRDEQIEREFQKQLLRNPRWTQLVLGRSPVKAKVDINTEGIGFEVLCIELLVNNKDKRKYEYEGEPLNTPIIRSILNTLSPWQEPLPIPAILEVITQYHLERGGRPTQLKDFRTNTYDILCAMEAEGRAERYREGNRDYWQLIQKQ